MFGGEALWVLRNLENTVEQVFQGTVSTSNRHGAAGWWAGLAPGLCVMFIACMAQPVCAFNFDDLEKIEKVESKERRVREARAAEVRREQEARRAADEASRQAAAANANQGGGARGSQNGSSLSSSNSGNGGSWTVESTRKERGVSWHSQITIKCTGGARRGETFPILALDSGRFQSIYGPTESTLKEVADFHCH